MTLVAAPPLVRWPGLISAITAAPALATDVTLDAAGEYICYVFQAKEAMSLSHIGWRAGTVAGSPTVDTRV